MRATILIAALVGTFLAQPLIAQEPASVGPTADTVYTNGHIYTPGGWASSVAVAKGVIVAVGDETAMRPVSDAHTRTVDLKGDTVLPGLHDMHVHPTGAGLSEMECQLPHGSSPQQIFDILKRCVKDKAPGDWITGRAYEAASFGATPPNKEMLDKIAPKNPVLFTDISGHSAWANSAALKSAGVDRDTPDPKGGIIERDANGEPTGILREAASWAVSARVPPATAEEDARALEWSLETMLKQGITSFDDALVTADIAAAYATIADAGKLKQRVRGCLVSTDETLIEHRQLYARDRFSPSCIKVILDGVPTDSHTAAMLTNYEHTEGMSPDRAKGLLQILPTDLNAELIRFDKMGMTVKMHAAGNAAVHEGLDAIEAARTANGFSGLLHDVAHNSFVDMADIRRARGIWAVFEFSPYIWYHSPIIDDIEKAVGDERMKRWIPIKDALDAGVLSIPGSDWAVVPSVNPWIAIETMVTRKKPGGIGPALGAQEAITLKQAIDMFTINSARQQYNSDKLGSIEIGKRADMVVIDRNIFEVPITTVHDTKVHKTIIDGEVVYDSSKAAL